MKLKLNLTHDSPATSYFKSVLVNHVKLVRNNIFLNVFKI